MATYAELAAINNDPGWNALREKVAIACTVKAAALIDTATPTQVQVDWALRAIKQRNLVADELIWYLIGGNVGLEVSVIMALGDTPIQNAVGAAVDKILAAV